MTKIAANVASWLNTYNQAHVGLEFNSSFEALANVTGSDLTSLVEAYSTPNPSVA